MSHVNPGRFGEPVGKLDRSDVSGQPFSLLTEVDDLEQLLQWHEVRWRDAVFTPLVTLQAFLAQVLDTHGSCREAVAKVLAWRISQGQPACSARTGGYCHARQRLPESMLQALVRQVGGRLNPSSAATPSRQSLAGPAVDACSRQAQAPAVSMRLLGGRPIRIIDGSTVSMPDTAANQREYPQARTQKPGLGFPIARIIAMFDLHSGAVLDAAIGPYKGKQTGENALFREVLGPLRPGDVVAGDCGFGSYWNFALLQQRCVDAVFPLHQCRPQDLRRGRRLGKEDRLVEWSKPRERPDWMGRATYQAMPRTLTLRQMRVHIDVPGSRVKRLLLVTNMVDPHVYSKKQMADVYHARWNGELDLRSIKTELGTDVLRCKTPAMVRKEFWMHLLAYNLLRNVMVQAADAHQCPPRQISFTGAWQTLRAFAPLSPSKRRDPMQYAALLKAIASHRVGNRPDRVEPRAVKRRPKPHPLLNEPRHKARSRLLRAA